MTIRKVLYTAISVFASLLHGTKYLSGLHIRALRFFEFD